MATAVKTAADTFNAAVEAAQAESVAVDVRINYAPPAGTPAAPGAMASQGITVAIADFVCDTLNLFNFNAEDHC